MCNIANVVCRICNMHNEKEGLTEVCIAIPIDTDKHKTLLKY